MVGLVEAERAGAARPGGEQGDALDHPADIGDVAVEVARGMADHRIELAAGAGDGARSRPTPTLA